MIKKRILLLLLVGMLSIWAAVPTAAGQSAGQSAGQTENESHTIVVQAGLAEMQVNGQSIAIVPPFVEDGLTMVPMSVFIRGLGTEFRLKDNKTISLTVPPHTVEAKIDSKSANVDGVAVTLAAAPTIRNGVVFIPIRTAELLGADIAYDPDTQQITIATAGPGPGTGGGYGATIDSDAGKDWIGDSYYQWTMNYPTGLVQDYKSDAGDEIIFRDLQNEFYLGIFIEPQEEILTTDERQEILVSEYASFDEIVLDKQTIHLDDYSYERITTKNRRGFYYEVRGLQANGFFYAIVFGKKASNLTDFRRHTDILDSFTPTFDRDEQTVKNVTNPRGNVVTLTSDNYGLSVDLPPSWSSDYWGAPLFSSEDEDAYLGMDVTSAVAGDTAEDWVARHIWRYENLFVPSYREAPVISEVTWSGIPALMVETVFSMDTQEWHRQYAIFAMQDKHRYYSEFTYPLEREDDYDTVINSILDTMTVDFQMIEREFGNLPDDNDWGAESPKNRKTNATYGFSMEVPKHWLSYSYSWSDEKLSVIFPGGTISVSVFEYDDPAEKLKEVLTSYRELTQLSNRIKLIEDRPVTFAGKSARKLVVEDTRSDGYRTPNRSTTYAFEHNGELYVVEGSYGLANGTEYVIGQMTEAMNSFRLLE